MTHIVGAARLRIKESDRLATVTAQLNASWGPDIEELPDALIDPRCRVAFNGGTSLRHVTTTASP